MKVYPSKAFTASGLVGGENSAVYYGFYITTTTAVGQILIRKGSVSGQIIAAIPTGTLTGTVTMYAHGIQMDAPIFIDFTTGSATGGIVVYYQ